MISGIPHHCELVLLVEQSASERCCDGCPKCRERERANAHSVICIHKVDRHLATSSATCHR